MKLTYRPNISNQQRAYKDALLILRPPLDRHCECLTHIISHDVHFTDEEAKVEKVEAFARGHPHIKWKRGDLNPRWLGQE